MKTSLLTIAAVLMALLQSCSGDEGYEPTAPGSLLQFSFLTIDGQKVSSDRMQGKPYVLVVFNTRCGDCKRELPVVNRAVGQYGGQMDFVVMSYKQTADEVAAYWADNGFTMPYLVPAADDVCRRLAPDGIPQIYVVGADGIVRASFNDSNMPDLTTLSMAIGQCLGTSQAAADSVTVHVRMRSASGGRSVIASESLITHVRLYFFGSDSRRLVACHDIDDISPLSTSVEDEYDLTYLLPAVKMPPGFYDVFAIANYDRLPDNVSTEADMLALQDSVTYASGIMSTLSDKGAIMTNCASSSLRQDFTNRTGSHVFVDVSMERAVAKVTIGKGSDRFELKHEGETYATVNLTNYKFVNLNTRFFLFRHTARLEGFRQPAEYVLPDNFSPDTDGPNTYVIDPTFFRKDGTAASYDYLQTVFRHYYTREAETDFAGLPAAGKYGTAYILENCAYRPFQNNGTSTGIIFKASVNPVCVYLYDNMSHSLVKETRPETYAETLYLFEGKFYNSVRALNFASGLELDELHAYTDAELAGYGVKQVRYYMGVFETYYSYWIGHSSLDGAMAYGIVRNNFYQLQVASVGSLGSSRITPDVNGTNAATSPMGTRGGTVLLIGF